MRHCQLPSYCRVWICLFVGRYVWYRVRISRRHLKLPRFGSTQREACCKLMVHQPIAILTSWSGLAHRWGGPPVNAPTGVAYFLFTFCTTAHCLIVSVWAQKRTLVEGILVLCCWFSNPSNTHPIPARVWYRTFAIPGSTMKRS